MSIFHRLKEETDYSMNVCLLSQLCEHFPLIEREPPEREKSFLKEEQSYQERRETEGLNREMHC
ncbi:hypothetical protein [Neobacillus soli]|uniref:hypothetical protein n=1 Tax=Neobacillus soli TaxID=220688 RepID=UPI00115529D6|nr:hypothetical protein [Neobacillus soli]